MAELKVWLSIGFDGADHEDVIDVCDNELATCKTDEERNELLEREFQEWANGYIEYTYELIGGDK